MIKQNIVDNSEVGVRSIQSMPFNWLGSADFGRIVPFHVQELLPTDKVVTCKPKIEVQMLPLASPTFGKLDLYCHYFFVPTRLCWQDALDFFSQSGLGQNAVPPFMTLSSITKRYLQSSSNYQRPLYKHLTSMGLPPFFTNQAYSGASTYPGTKTISALPFRAYRRIWWDYYRDPELISDASFAQYMSLGGGQLSVNSNDNVDSLLLQPLIRSCFESWHAQVFKNNGSQSPQVTLGIDTGDSAVYSQENTSENIRYMEAITRLSERLSLSGKRQIDRLFAQYGVKPDFVKMSMCEYIGGAKSSVLVSDITSSANTTTFDEQGQDLLSGSPLGMKAGAGYCAFNNLNVKYTAKEHGYLIGVFSVMPHLHYVQGIGRQWNRTYLNDWYRKELEHTGMVAIPKCEVGIRGQFNYDNSYDTQTYAFTQPYYDYRRNVDILAGDFMKYHDNGSSGSDVAYMQSMGLYLNFPTDRDFKMENLRADLEGVNKIFYYLGGNLFTDSDDHFHLNIDTDVVINRPMDGFAVPTLETTEDPHKSKEPLSQSVKL